MPIIKSAKKKMRKDKKRTVKNTAYVAAYKKAIKKVKRGKGDLSNLISQVYSLIDRAVKKKIIHKNKAGRLKSRISQFAKKK